MRIRLLLPCAAILLSACVLPDGLPDGPTSGTLYRDVFWRAIGIDGVMTNEWRYPLQLGSYTRQSGGGATETCVVSGFLQTGSFGWVEVANTGQVVRSTPVEPEGPYDLFSVNASSACGGADEPAWSFDGIILVEAIAIKSQGALDIRSIRAGTMMLNQAFVGTGEAERWLQVHLDNAPLADTMNVPVTITVRAWQSDGSTLIGTWTRTVVLTYLREEAVYEREQR